MTCKLLNAFGLCTSGSDRPFDDDSVLRIIFCYLFPGERGGD
jgi:hypothetical protein